mgnify:CR=1 FL=1
MNKRKIVHKKLILTANNYYTISALNANPYILLNKIWEHVLYAYSKYITQHVYPNQVRKTNTMSKEERKPRGRKDLAS